MSEECNQILAILVFSIYRLDAYALSTADD